MTVGEAQTVEILKVTAAPRFPCYYFIDREATDRDKRLCQR